MRPRRAIGARLRRPADLAGVLAPDQRNEATHDRARRRDQPGDFRRARNVVTLPGVDRARADCRCPRIHGAREHRNSGKAGPGGLPARHSSEHLPRVDPAQLEEAEATVEPIRERMLRRTQVVVPRIGDAVRRDFAGDPEIEEVLRLEDGADSSERFRLPAREPRDARDRVERGDRIGRIVGRKNAPQPPGRRLSPDDRGTATRARAGVLRDRAAPAIESCPTGTHPARERLGAIDRACDRRSGKERATRNRRSSRSRRLPDRLRVSPWTPMRAASLSPSAR